MPTRTGEKTYDEIAEIINAEEGTHLVGKDIFRIEREALKKMRREFMRRGIGLHDLLADDRESYCIPNIPHYSVLDDPALALSVDADESGTASLLERRESGLATVGAARTATRARYEKQDGEDEGDLQVAA